jgi:hypothetical protein
MSAYADGREREDEASSIGLPLPRRRMSAYADGRERAGVRGRRVYPSKLH